MQRKAINHRRRLPTGSLAFNMFVSEILAHCWRDRKAHTWRMYQNCIIILFAYVKYNNSPKLFDANRMPYAWRHHQITWCISGIDDIDNGLLEGHQIFAHQNRWYQSLPPALQHNALPNQDTCKSSITIIWSNKRWIIRHIRCHWLVIRLIISHVVWYQTKVVPHWLNVLHL